jgi:hypothetical protein
VSGRPADLAREEAELQGERLRQTLDVLPEAVVIADTASGTSVSAKGQGSTFTVRLPL